MRILLLATILTCASSLFLQDCILHVPCAMFFEGLDWLYVRRYISFIRRNLEFSTLDGGYFSSTLIILCLYVGTTIILACTGLFGLLTSCYWPMELLDRGTSKLDWTDRTGIPFD